MKYYNELLIQVFECNDEDVITTSGYGETVKTDRVWEENPWQGGVA